MQTLFSARGDGDVPERPAIPAWLQPPQDEYPARVVVGRILHRDAGTVIAATHVDAYSAGLLIDVDVFLRRTTESARDWSWLTRGAMGAREAVEIERAQLWGVVLPDGTAATSIDPLQAGRSWADEPEGWSLRYAGGHGGGGGNDRFHQNRGLWLWPLPPPGPLTLVVSWLDRDVAECRVELDGAAYLDAVPRARALWPSS